MRLKFWTILTMLWLLQPIMLSAYAQQMDARAVLSSEIVDKFKPRPTDPTEIDYSAWSELLQVMVLPTGQSTRLSAPKPSPMTGTRIILSHKSPYRMEGNKIAFSKFHPEFTALVSEYRRELEMIGTDIDISKLARNEQLAYWMNLHNVTVIEQIALAYPETSPADLKIGSPKAPFHDAKILSVGDSKLSLRDIRENIVYENWSDPVVMYGFFLGEIGSPSIQNYAFNAGNVQTGLNVSAYEFVNSLRGFRQGRVSKLYRDNAGYFFPDFQQDVRVHLEKYMRDNVSEELSRYKSLSVGKYEYMIADIVGGHGNRTQGLPVQVTSADSAVGIKLRNDPFAAYISELREKQIKLREMGLTKRGTVIIEDIETITNENEIE